MIQSRNQLTNHKIKMRHISRKVTVKKVTKLKQQHPPPPAPSPPHMHTQTHATPLPPHSSRFDRLPKLNLIHFLSHSGRKLFPPPASSTPPPSAVGVLREHRACRCWCSTTKAVPTSVQERRLPQPIAGCSHSTVKQQATERCRSLQYTTFYHHWSSETLSRLDPKLRACEFPSLKVGKIHRKRGRKAHI